MKRYNWAVLGCGSIAGEMAAAMRREGRSLYAVGSRSPEKAAAFARTHGISKVYREPCEMFTDPAVDIVYVATPHNTHLPYLLQALQSGKHVLCEKSITLNLGELEQAMALAQKNRLVLAEAMTLYHMPLYKKLRELAAGGALGPLRFLQVSFGSYKEYNMNNRFFAPNLAGGALLDIGVYALAFVRWFMGEAPDQIVSQVKYAPSGVDEQAGILLMNPRQEMASVTLTLHAKQPKRGVAVFDKGFVEIYEYPRAEQALITYTANGRQETLRAGGAAHALQYEIADMEKAVSGRGNHMHLDYTRDVMKMMTELRAGWHLKYPEEA